MWGGTTTHRWIPSDIINITLNYFHKFTFTFFHFRQCDARMSKRQNFHFPHFPNDNDVVHPLYYIHLLRPRLSTSTILQSRSNYHHQHPVSQSCLSLSLSQRISVLENNPCWWFMCWIPSWTHYFFHEILSKWKIWHRLCAASPSDSVCRLRVLFICVCVSRVVEQTTYTMLTMMMNGEVEKA